MPSSEREVNNLLNLLRAQEFRRQQNRQRSRSHLTSRIQATQAHSLPQVYDYLPENDTAPPPFGQPRTGRRGISGPSPPPSWNRSQITRDLDPSNPYWRYKALKPFLERTYALSAADPGRQNEMTPNLNFFEPLPSLRNLCIDTLICLFGDSSLDQQKSELDESSQMDARLTPENLVAQLLPYIPPSAVLDLARHAAIHNPFSGPQVLSLYERGSADGEVILIGPTITHKLLQKLLANLDQSLSSVCGTGATPDTAATNSLPTSWDDASSSRSLEEPTPITSLAILSPSPSSPPLLTPNLPPTITHLALLHFPIAPSILSRLPSILPLIEFFDLSFNAWLLPPPALFSINTSVTVHRAAYRITSEGLGDGPPSPLSSSLGFPISRIAWGAWTHLCYVGLREVGNVHVNGSGFRNEEVMQGIRKMIGESVKRKTACVVDFG